MAPGAPMAPVALGGAPMAPAALACALRAAPEPDCAPIAPAGRDAESLRSEVERWIEAEMRRLSPHLYARAQPAGEPA